MISGDGEFPSVDPADGVLPGCQDDVISGLVTVMMSSLDRVTGMMSSQGWFHNMGSSPLGVGRLPFIGPDWIPSISRIPTVITAGLRSV